MRLLHTSDWHIGKTLFEYSLLDDQQAFLNTLYEILKAEQIDVLLISGDLFDRSVPSAQAVKVLDDALWNIAGEMGITVLAIAGNHDSPQRLTFGERLGRQMGVRIVGGAEKEIVKVTLEDQWGPVHFYLLPYLQPADLRPLYPQEEISTFQDAYSFLLEENQPRMDFSQRNVLLLHGFFAPLSGSAKANLLTSESETVVGGTDLVDANLFDHFDYCAAGHLHLPQTPSANLRYSGSPLKYSLSEAGTPKSVTIVELGEKGNLSVREQLIPPLRDLQVITGSIQQLLSPIFLPFEQQENYIFAQLTDKSLVLHAMEKLSVLYPNILGLRYLALESDASETVTLGAQKRQEPLPNLFDQFFATIKGEEMSAQQHKIMDKIYEKLAREEDK